MRGVYDQAISSIKEEGLSVFLDRSVRYSTLKLKRLFESEDKENLQKWKDIKNKYKGKRAFILGNGPSLNETPLYLLKDEFTMCFNRVNMLYERLSWKPDFFAITDDLVYMDMLDDLNGKLLEDFEYSFFPDITPYNINFKEKLKARDNVLWLHTDTPGFSLNLPYCGINQSVVNAGLQILAYLGFTEIYVLGVDMSFASHTGKKLSSRDWEAKDNNDISHFDPRYWGKGKKYHTARVDIMAEKFDDAYKFFTQNGVNIYNSTIGGKLEAFPRKAIRELFNYPEEEERQLFIDGINPKLSVDAFLKFWNESKVIKTVEEFSVTDEVFTTDNVLGKDLIRTAILSHIPFGPYQNKYIFIDRNSNILQKINKQDEPK
jgi:hypothetical protein